MARKRRWWKHRPGKYKGGYVIVNQKDYTRHDYISPGRLVAWADWVQGGMIYVQTSSRI